jgi:hypothetical protein
MTVLEFSPCLVCENDAKPNSITDRLTEADFRQDLEVYLANLTSSKVRTLTDIIQYNKDHATKELPPGIALLLLMELI